MNVARVKDRARIGGCASCGDSSRRTISSKQISMKQFDSVKDMRIKNLTVPDDVRTGESFIARVEVENGAVARNGIDWCADDRNPCSHRQCVAPTCVEIEWSFGGETKRNSRNCQCGAVLGANTAIYSDTFIAPQTPGEYEFSALLRLMGSGNPAGPIRDTIAVTEGSPKQPPKNGNGNGGGPDLSTIAIVGMLAIGAGVVLFGDGGGSGGGRNRGGPV